MSEAGSSADAPAVKLWGVCALIGHHLPEAGPCAQHAPCDCSALDARHLRFHPRCSFCEPTKQRSEVWPALTGMIPCGDVMLTEADGRSAENPTLAWFFGVPQSIYVEHCQVDLHVRGGLGHLAHLLPACPRGVRTFGAYLH